MAGDIQLQERFPGGRSGPQADQFTGKTVDDALSAIPPGIKQAWRRLTTETKEMPCKIAKEATGIYGGLRKGTLTLKSVGNIPGYVTLQDKDGKDVTFHSGHASAMMQMYGLENIERLLKEKLPAEAVGSIGYGVAGMSIRDLSIIGDGISRDPRVDSMLPVHPDVTKCFTS